MRHRNTMLRIALALFLMRVATWTLPGTWIGEHAKSLYYGLLSGWGCADLLF